MWYFYIIALYRSEGNMPIDLNSHIMIITSYKLRGQHAHRSAAVLNSHIMIIALYRSEGNMALELNSHIMIITSYKLRGHIAHRSAAVLNRHIMIITSFNISLFYSCISYSSKGMYSLRAVKNKINKKKKINLKK